MQDATKILEGQLQGDKLIDLSRVAGQIWEKPLPLDAPPKKPEYPIHVFPADIRRYVAAVAEQYQVPLSFAGTCALAAVSIATLKRCVLSAGRGDVTHLNAYFVTALESGSGKSSCLGSVNAPIYDFEQRLVAAVIAAAPDGDASDIGVLSSDPTCEALEKRLRANNGAFAVCNAEASDLFGIICGRYNNGASNFSIYLKGFSGELHRPDRILRGATHIPNPRLALNLALQPVSFERYWNQPEFAERGVTGRFFVDRPDSRLGYRDSDPPPVPKGLREEWAQTIGELLDVKPPKNDSGEPHPHCIRMTAKAHATLQVFRERAELGLRAGGEWEQCREFGARAAEHLCKLAGLLHCLTFPTRPWGEDLSDETLRLSLQLFDYYATFSRGVIPSATDEKKTKQLAYLLERISSKVDWGSMFRVSDLWFLVKGRAGIQSTAYLRSLLGELEDLGYLREAHLRGSKVTHYFVSPHVFSGNRPKCPK